MGMQAYLGYKLTDTERTQLLQAFPPAYPDILADHITIALTRPDILPAAHEITLLGMADDGIGLQALVTAIDGQSARADGAPYHLTWSCDPAKLTPAAYDLSLPSGAADAGPYRPRHSGPMIALLKSEGRINWFDTPLTLPARQAVFDDRSGKYDRPEQAASHTKSNAGLFHPRYTQDIG